MAPPRNLRKRNFDEDDGETADDAARVALEEVKLLQKLRERKTGIPALPSSSGSATGAVAAAAPASIGGLRRPSGGDGGGDAEKEDLVLQDTFAQETAVTIEDPNMLKYVERELSKRRGGAVDSSNGKREDKEPVNELYVVPDHLKVKKRNSEESSTQWTTGIAEVQLPIEFKLKNIEETEAAKKLLQEKQLAGKAKSDVSIPSSYSADFLHRGRDNAERVRRDHPELYKERGLQSGNEKRGRPNEGNLDGAKRREAATDELLFERFRKQEKFRVMRR